MQPLWNKTLCLMLTLALTAGSAFAIEPMLPNPKDAVTSKITDTKSAARTEAAKATAAKDAATTTAADAKASAKAKAAALTQVDINSASEAELKSIPGIGEAYAAKIVAGRPYAKKDQLKSRNILTGPAYDQVKDHIIAKQPAPKKK
jgi:DNA uptake protein ComE-like DNA-binding protein